MYVHMYVCMYIYIYIYIYIHRAAPRWLFRCLEGPCGKLERAAPNLVGGVLRPAVLVEDAGHI